MTFIKTSALEPLKKEVITTDHYNKLIDFLQVYYPEGFDYPTDVYTMFDKVEVENYDMELHEDAVIIMVERPAVAAALGLAGIAAWLVNTAVMLAVNFVVSKLFAPDTPKNAQQLRGGDTVYSLNNAQNSANLGAPIPIGYGTFRMFPSYVEQPYYKYENNEEYLYLLLCIGQGRYNINKLQIDTLDMTNSPSVQYKLVNKENFGNIAGYINNNQYNVRNNLMSSPSSLELKPWVWSDFYSIKSGVNAVEFDYMYPGGYVNIGDDGHPKPITVSFDIIFYNSLKSLIYKDTISVTGRTRETIRKTISYNVNVNFKYFRIVKTSYKWTPTSIDNTIIVRVKEKYPSVDLTKYGDITLLYARVKATNAISAAGQQQVNGYFTRTDKGNKITDVLTDIYSNGTYGGRLNHSDLHLGSANDPFNGVFESKQTVIDAMKQVSKAQKYTVFPVGQDIILKKDAPTNITTALFNETNILSDTFSIAYNFKNEIEQYDSVECQYRDSSRWEIATEKYPTSGIYPQAIDLFGVTSANKAKEMAKYLYKQDASRRKVITFDTDIQFLNLEFLDKIKISHSAVLWGQAGEVIDRVGSWMKVSEKVSGNSNITIRNKDGSISDTLSFTKINDFEINVNNLPAWVTHGLGYTIGIAKEFLVTGVRPKNEDSATVECIQYDAGIYT